MTSESPDAVAPLREDEMMHDTDSSMVVEPTPNISVYLEEIAKLRRDLQGAQKLAEHRLQVIFELQDAAARVGSAEEKQEGEAEAPKVKLQSLSKSTADCSAPVARPKLLSRQGMLTLKDNNPTYAAKENRAASVRATSVTSAAKSIKRASRMREESQHADPLRGLNPNTGAPAQTTPSVESACANTPGSPRPKKLLRRPLTKPSSSSLPAEERRGEETALRRRVKKSIESSATTSLQTAETDKKRPTTASSLKKLAPSENGGKRDVTKE
ncbi:hypothetical protein ADEAN_000459300 [Angomonas deanei]|uniref:Uncharacterized protein n=1 Tax=Angomonas deanei TaxID=59799 RepID=A0A7G2CCF2_9TRYP|nr:hypothetical protein ADEAN_000459300 [Angomonas deanei]